MSREMSATAYWKQRVLAHHEQSLRIQATNAWSIADMWQPSVARFSLDPRRTPDPVLARLIQAVEPQMTVLDVGGGAGRFALPLALHSKQVTVVEPAQSMVEGLQRNAQAAGIDTVSIVQQEWEAVTVEGADVVLCAHVLYGVTDIEPFLRKLQASAKKCVLILAFMEAPITRYEPFWGPVHGEERRHLPAAPDLLAVLWEMGIYPNLEMLATYNPDAFESWDAALEVLRHYLFVNPTTAADERLQQAMQRLLVPEDGGITIQGAQPRREALLLWHVNEAGV